MPMLGRPPTPAGNLRSFRFVPAPLSPIQCCVRPTGMSRQFKRMTQAALRSPQHWTGGWGSGATQKIRSEFSDAWRGARAERRRGRPIKFLFGRVVGSDHMAIASPRRSSPQSKPKPKDKCFQCYANVANFLATKPNRILR